jgi:hypothetical protein
MPRIKYARFGPLQNLQAVMQFLLILNERRTIRLASVGNCIANKDAPIGSQYGYRPLCMPRGMDYSRRQTIFSEFDEDNLLDVAFWVLIHFISENTTLQLLELAQATLGAARAYWLQRR